MNKLAVLAGLCFSALAQGATLTVDCDAGATIIGGCCGTSPEHLAAMRAALDSYEPGPRPDLDAVVAKVGALTNTVASDAEPGSARRRRRGGAPRRAR